MLYHCLAAEPSQKQTQKPSQVLFFFSESENSSLPFFLSFSPLFCLSVYLSVSLHFCCTPRDKVRGEKIDILWISQPGLRVRRKEGGKKEGRRERGKERGLALKDDVGLVSLSCRCPRISSPPQEECLQRKQAIGKGMASVWWDG